MTKEFDNETAAAHGLFMVVVFFITAAILWMALGYIINLMLIGSINPAIIAGDVSMQTVSTTRGIIDVVRVGIIGIVGVSFYWAYKRSVYVGEGGQ